MWRPDLCHPTIHRKERKRKRSASKLAPLLKARSADRRPPGSCPQRISAHWGLLEDKPLPHEGWKRSASGSAFNGSPMEIQQTPEESSDPTKNAYQARARATPLPGESLVELDIQRPRCVEKGHGASKPLAIPGKPWPAYSRIRMSLLNAVSGEVFCLLSTLVTCGVSRRKRASTRIADIRC